MQLHSYSIGLYKGMKREGGISMTSLYRIDGLHKQCENFVSSLWV